MKNLIIRTRHPNPTGKQPKLTAHRVRSDGQLERQRKVAIKSEKEGIQMRETDRDRITCQIYIEQRDGGTVWVPCKTLIRYEMAGRFGSGDEDDRLYSGKEFATLKSAVDAAEQHALNLIHEKHPSVRRDDVDWCLVSEEVSGFVAV
jgi:hypothetical protein